MRVLRVKVGRSISIDAAREMLGEMSGLFRHPNLLLHMGTCGLESVDADLMIISEYLPMGFLLDNVQKNGAGVPSQVCAWTLELCRALCFLHTATPQVRDLCVCVCVCVFCHSVLVA